MILKRNHLLSVSIAIFWFPDAHQCRCKIVFHTQPYIDRCKRDRFTTQDDKTFLMFDLDVPGILEHLRKIKDAVLLLSNSCIEYWFVLHYRDTNKELSSSERLAILRSIDADYAMGTFSTTMKKVLIDSIEDAANRAKAKGEFDYANPRGCTTLK